MIDHLSLGVRDLRHSREFYDAALAPLGYRRRFDGAEASGYGAPGAHPLREQALPFWIASGWIAEETQGGARSGHVCFAAPHRDAVDAFHRAALAAGGRDNGGPGLRRNITHAITPLSSSIPTGIGSKPFVTRQNETSSRS